MTNPFLTVHGPRPETWWVVCNLCGKTSSARFRSAADAEAWEHDCHTEADDDGTVTLTVEFSLDDPPEISWKGQLHWDRLDVIEHALSDMRLWARKAQRSDCTETWRDAVQANWEKREEHKRARVIKEFEESIRLPYVCPGCKERYSRTSGLKNHMRACYRIDPFKLKRGEYDDQMVPGGVPS